MKHLTMTKKNVDYGTILEEGIGSMTKIREMQQLGSQLTQKGDLISYNSPN